MSALQGAEDSAASACADAMQRASSNSERFKDFVMIEINPSLGAIVALFRIVASDWI
jgi:hypothetical protein